MKKFIAMLMLVCMLTMVGCGGGSAKVESGKLGDVHTAVKTALGDAYIAVMPYDMMFLTEVVGLTEADIKEFVAEGPMMSAHVDTFIGIEAVEGKGEAVEEALKAYVEVLKSDAFMYPMNVAKVETAKVVRVDDYVFYICLGGYHENVEATEEECKAFYTQQNELVEKAIHDTLGK